MNGVITYDITYEYIEGGVIVYSYTSKVNAKEVVNVITPIMTVAAVATAVYLTGGIAVPAVLYLFK